MTRLDAYASARHYADHLLPAWLRAPSRGTFWAGTLETLEWVADRLPEGSAALLPVRHRILDPVVVASYRDLSAVRKRGARAIAYMEHGVGQSYGGDRRSARHPSYAGGDGRDGVSLILAPNVPAADRWRERYPRIPVHVVGATRVLTPPEDPGRSLLVVSFHWSSALVPEMRSALPHYRDGLGDVAAALPLALHAHPRAAAEVRALAAALRVPFLPDLRDVARRATVYAVDNSSTLWELGRTRPVVALNAPWYRFHVEHGLRFWSHVPEAVGSARELVRVAGALLAGDETAEAAADREAFCREVIPHLDGAERAATLLAGWLDGMPSVATRDPLRGVSSTRRARTVRHVSPAGAVPGDGGG